MFVHQLLQCNLNLRPLGLLCRRDDTLCYAIEFSSVQLCSLQVQSHNLATIFCKLSTTQQANFSNLLAVLAVKHDLNSRKIENCAERRGKSCKSEIRQTLQYWPRKPNIFLFGKDAKIYGCGWDRLKYSRDFIPQRDVAREGARNNCCPQNWSFRRGVHFFREKKNQYTSSS